MAMMTYAWLWTLLAFVLTWMVFHLIKMKKAATEDVEAEAEERSDGATDVIIVWAGVAGDSLAYALAKDGRRVHVIERDLNEPQRFMGELMQAGGRFMLAQLGLEDCLEEIDAQEAKSLAIYKDGKHATLPFPDDKKFPHEPVGRLLRNGRLVQRLRQKAASLSNVQLEEGTVKSLIEENGVVKGVTYKNSAGEETTAFAPLTVVCDGCYSNLRRSLVDNTPMSATVNTLASIFSQVLVATTDEAREGMRQGCFNYLARGDFKTAGLMTILGGMNPHPLTLVLHLVAITLTSMGHLLSPFPSPRRFWHSLRLFAWALQMLGAHLVDEGFKEMLIPTNAARYRRTYIATTTV